MERLKNILKNLQGTAQRLRAEIDDANVVISDLYLEIDIRNEMSPGNEHSFDVVLNAIHDLDIDLKNFIETKI